MLIYAMDVATTDYASSWLQYGAVGAAAVILALFAKALIKREQDRSDRLESDMRELRKTSSDEVTRLNTVIQDRTIPALITATQAIQASQSILQQIQYQKDVQAAAAKARSGEVSDG